MLDYLAFDLIVITIDVDSDQHLEEKKTHKKYPSGNNI